MWMRPEKGHFPSIHLHGFDIFRAGKWRLRLIDSRVTALVVLPKGGGGEVEKAWAALSLPRLSLYTLAVSVHVGADQG